MIEKVTADQVVLIAEDLGVSNAEALRMAQKHNFLKCLETLPESQKTKDFLREMIEVLFDY